MEVADPSSLVPPIEAVIESLGVVLDTFLGPPESKESTENVNISANPCDLLAPIDKANADKPGVVEYETDIGDSSMKNFPYFDYVCTTI